MVHGGPRAGARPESSMGDATQHQSSPRELLRHEEAVGNLTDRTEGGGEA
jgi:hypothetical protein